MECHIVKSRIGNYLDQVISSAERREVDDHLRECRRCAIELEQLKQIDTLYGQDLFDDPAPEYWDTFTATVTERIGVRRKERSKVGVISFLEQFLSVPSFGWGLVGAVAIVLALLVGREFFFSESPDSIANKLPETGTEEQAVAVNEAEASQNVDGSVSEIPEKDVSGFDKEQLVSNPESVNEQEITNSEEVVRVRPRGFRLTKITSVELKPLRHQDNPHFDEELIPLPHAGYTYAGILGENSDEDEDASGLTVQTLALDSKIQTGNRNSAAHEDENLAAENRFFEIVAIVNTSPTLEEKRNIWLSYLSREPSSTYRSLANFYLADVLYEWAKETRDLEKARDAVEFFRENEKSLRVQMRDNVYESRLNVLVKILME